MLGGLPSTRTPLNARVTGTIPMAGYRIEKVVFESLPGIHVTALVYVPDGGPADPAGGARGLRARAGRQDLRTTRRSAGQLARAGTS